MIPTQTLPAMTKYKCMAGSNVIELVIAEKETKQSLWIRDGRLLEIKTGTAYRVAKSSSYENYFDTWSEARAFLLEAAEQSLVSARRRLDLAQSHYGNIKGMKEPV